MNTLSGSRLALGVIALIGEVILFAALGQILHWLPGGGWRGLLVAAAGLVVAAVLWSIFMAPTAARRVGVLARVSVTAVAGIGLGALLAGAGWPRFGAATIVAGLAVAGSQWLTARSAVVRPAGGAS